MNKTVEEKTRIIKIASIVAPIICVVLVMLGKEAQANGELVRAYILAMTSAIEAMILLAGMAHYWHTIKREGVINGRKR